MVRSREFRPLAWQTFCRIVEFINRQETSLLQLCEVTVITVAERIERVSVAGTETDPWKSKSDPFLTSVSVSRSTPTNIPSLPNVLAWWDYLIFGSCRLVAEKFESFLTFRGLPNSPLPWKPCFKPMQLPLTMASSQFYPKKRSS